MDLKRLVWIIFIVVTVQLQLPAQAIFERITDENGLPHNSVRNIIVDQQGLVWLGTLGGIHRYDGFDYKSLQHQPGIENSLPSDDVTAFATVGDSLLWIGTDNGLCRFDFRTFRLSLIDNDLTQPKRLTEPRIRSLVFDEQQRLWVGTRDSGLFVMENHRQQQFVPIPEGDLQFIRSLKVDSKQRLWVGSYSNGVALIDTKLPVDAIKSEHFDLQGYDPEAVSCPVYDIFEEEGGMIWLATRNGLFWFDEQLKQFNLLRVETTKFDPLLLNTFNCIESDHNGNIWLGTYNGLIRCRKLMDLAKGQYECYVHNAADKNSLLSNQVNTLCTDSSGVVWIGTDNGLMKFNPFKNQFRILHTENLNPDTPIESTCFAEDRYNNLLIGTHSLGLLRLQNNKIIRTALAKTNITAIYSDDHVSFWIGTWDGKLIYYNSMNDQVIKTLVVDGNDPVSSITDGFDGKIIFTCFSNGAYLVDKKSFVMESFNNYVPDLIQFQNKAFKDKSGIIWLGSNSGLYRYDPEKRSSVMYRFPKDNVYNNNYNVSDLCQDEEGVLWIGTINGIYYFNTAKNCIEKVNLKDPSQNLNVTNLIARDGTIYINLNYNRLGIYKPATNEFYVLMVNNGSRSNNYGLRGFMLSKDQTIWFGGENEVNYFKPGELTLNQYAPVPLIVDFKVSNREVMIGEKLNGQVVLDRVANLKEEITLNYRNRNFALSFASPTYIDQQRNLYAYMLEGFQERWDTVTSRNRNIQFTNLRPGRYHLHLKARNDVGFWSEERIVDIRVLPPFWLSGYAYLLYLLLLTGGSFLAYRMIRVRTELKNQLLIEKVKSERDEKHMNEKIRFFTNISHELKTPLTLILGPARQLMEQPMSDAQTQKKQSLIYNNASRLLRLVNELIDFRKAELNTLKIHVSQTEIVEFIKDLHRSFQPLAAEKKLKFTFTSNKSQTTGWIDQEKLEKIVFNLLSNAFKFTEHGRIGLDLEFSDQKMRILVSDSGIGIPQNKQQNIFDRFYQVRNHVKYNTGSGIGLSLSKSLVELHHGEIGFESTEGKGTQFWVDLPIAKEDYTPEETIDSPSFSIAEEKMEETGFRSHEGTETDCKVLIIEDHTELRQYLKDILSGEFLVVEATNGAEGMEKVKEALPDIIISDIMMEKMDGFEFCRQLKNDDEISHIPVILLTALSETEHLKEGYKLGADDYIVKPFDASILKVRIHNLIENRKKLMKHYSSDPESTEQTLSHSVADDAFLTKLRSYIEENIENELLDIEMICSKFNYSQSKLYRKVKGLTDLPPNELIRTIRLKKGAELLKTGFFNISEVSAKVGFNDPLYFSRCFSKQFGFPPSKIAKKE